MLDIYAKTRPLVPTTGNPPDELQPRTISEALLPEAVETTTEVKTVLENLKATSNPPEEAGKEFQAATDAATDDAVEIYEAAANKISAAISAEEAKASKQPDQEAAEDHHIKAPIVAEPIFINTDEQLRTDEQHLRRIRDSLQHDNTSTNICQKGSGYIDGLAIYHNHRRKQHQCYLTRT